MEYGVRVTISVVRSDEVGIADELELNYAEMVFADGPLEALRYAASRVPVAVGERTT